MSKDLRREFAANFDKTLVQEFVLVEGPTLVRNGKSLAARTIAEMIPVQEFDRPDDFRSLMAAVVKGLQDLVKAEKASFLGLYDVSLLQATGPCHDGSGPTDNYTDPMTFEQRTGPVAYKAAMRVRFILDV